MLTVDIVAPTLQLFLERPARDPLIFSNQDSHFVFIRKNS